MKKTLTILSSIIVFTIASNGFANLNQNNTIISNLHTNNNDNNTVTSLFNNYYHYLNNDNWITNQSTVDHKFYSYDTNYADYQLNNGINARSVFMVDTTGNLVFNPHVTVLDKDKLDLENTKQEIIDNRKITTIKDDYNPYSNSQYSNSYFSGDNNNWQFIQQGGVEKQIDISQQFAGDRVEHSNNLSENLGLYYIAKAARENKITQEVADNLAIYFISQSSLKEQISNKLTTKILTLIIDNENVYNFIKNIPMTINDKNYSLNYIFDSNNNLMKIYYTKWKRNNIKENISYKYSDSYNGSQSSNNDDGPNTILLSSWKKYARNWESFIKKYPTLNFDNNSYIKVQSQYGTNIKMGLQLNIKSIDIDKNNLWYIENIHNGGFLGALVELQAWVLIAHDDNNIYLRWHIHEFAFWATKGLFFNIYINNCDFINIMN